MRPMTYGQVRDKSLRLINQYSLAGNKIARTYNNQADYLMRIPDLVDEAQQIIASIDCRPIQENKELRMERVRDKMGIPVFRLPDDLLDIRPGGLLVVKRANERPTYESGWARPDEKHIILPRLEKDFKGRVFLEYYRQPRSIMDCGEDCCNQETCICKQSAPSENEPPDCALLDNSPDTHRPIPFFVAAFLVLQEDPYNHAILFNQWTNRLQQLRQAPQAHRSIVEDTYGLTDVYFTGGEY